MSKLYVPPGYRPLLTLYETQTAIGFIRKTFEEKLSRALSLSRVSAPLFVAPQTGLNDDLSGCERPVAFDIKHTGQSAEIVHSLAKWKRMALHRYGFATGQGLLADMNAVRRDEEMDNLHSVYVDQWDWEKVIDRETRNADTLKQTVRAIAGAICETARLLAALFPAVTPELSDDVHFITTQQLEDLYPALTPRQREEVFVKEHRTAFIMQIGGPLRSGGKHDERAPDYDDWNYNGDILFWNETLGCAFEISSMGIRVDAAALREQLAMAGCVRRAALPFHRQLLAGELPLTIGGGIGQSRLCMLMLKKAHIGEVQVSVWDEATLSGCADAGIPLL